MTKTGQNIAFLRDKFKDIVEDEVLKTKKMHEDYLIDVKNGGLPDEVNWLNIKYNSRNRKIRKTSIWLIAIILILFAFSFMVFIKNTEKTMKKEIRD